MILQALVQYYESLEKTGRDDLPRLGWSRVVIHHEVVIDLNGNLKAIIPITNEDGSGRFELVPEHMKRSGKTPPPYYLCDSATYVLGIENGVVSEKSKGYFSSFATKNIAILSQSPCAESDAIILFLKNWKPDEGLNNSIVREAIGAKLSNGNVTFRIEGASTIAVQAPILQNGWNDYYQSLYQDGQVSVCLVTGKTEPVARIHNSVKGIYAKSLAPNGWTLVSFDKGSPAYNSYGKEQGFNAPTSKYAAFAYTSALNHLLAEREYVGRIGDTTVLFWASGGQRAYQSFSVASLFGAPTTYSLSDLQKMTLDLCQGKPVLFEETQLDPNTTFYILGLSPNAARLSVRFFLRNSFGAFVKNIQAHQERLEIVCSAFDKFETLPLWKLLDETVNQNARDKSPVPGMAGETLRAILSDTSYPATLLNGVSLRIRAEREMTRGRAAILKAYYLKNPHPDVPKEVLTVSLNPDSTSVPYNLGRLFSVLEAIQSSANPGINTTIKDKYFNAASATPSRVFPPLINLAQKHLRKLDRGMSISYDKRLTELTAKLGEGFPDRLNLPQQGAFQLGYYHQTQARYQK